MAIRKKAGPAPPPRKDATQGVSSERGPTEVSTQEVNEPEVLGQPKLRVVSPPLPPIRPQAMVRRSTTPPPPPASFQTSVGGVVFVFRGEAAKESDVLQLQGPVNSLDSVALICQALRRLRALTPVEVLKEPDADAGKRWLSVLEELDVQANAKVQTFLNSGGEEEFLRQSS